MMNKPYKNGWLKRQIRNARAEVASRPEWMKQLREPGWLQIQLDRCSAEVKTWPEWMQRVLREDYSMKYKPLPESILNDLERGAYKGNRSISWILDYANPALLDLICEVQEWRQKAQTQADAVRLLENFTPGGSEFAGSPERCAKWVSDFMSSTLQHAAMASGERNQLREQLTVVQMERNAYKGQRDRAWNVIDRSIGGDSEVGTPISEQIDRLKQIETASKAFIDAWLAEEDPVKITALIRELSIIFNNNSTKPE